MFGNFFLALTALLILGLFFLNISKPPQGANAMGYAALLIIQGAGLIFCHLILTIVLLNKNGFDWVSDSRGTRIIVGLFCWGVVCLTTIMCASFKWEWHIYDGFPNITRWLAIHEGQLWIPLLALVPYYFLLNPTSQTSVPFQAIKTSLLVSIAISTVFSGSLLFGYCACLK